jgi:hypothetical protein
MTTSWAKGSKKKAANKMATGVISAASCTRSRNACEMISLRPFGSDQQ